MKVLLSFLLISSLQFSAHAQSAPLPAKAVLQNAIEKAAKENKNVLLIFHASWCGWCHKMDAALQDKAVKKYFDDHYIITHLTVLESAGKKHLENPGANEMLAQYGGENSGIPFWMVYDKAGTLLADAMIRAEGAGLDKKGTNSGCPATKVEVAHFIKVLKNTSPLQQKELSLIEARFRQNEQ